MIVNFAGKMAQAIYDGVNSKQARRFPQDLHAKARRLLDQLNAAPTLEFMKIPPGNRLEKLSGNLKGFWSLRVNDQWRIIFRWQNTDAHDVNIVDYHWKDFYVAQKKTTHTSGRNAPQGISGASRRHTNTIRSPSRLDVCQA